MLENTSFDPVYNAGSMDEAANVLEELLFFLFDSSFPTRKVMMSDRDPFWVTPQIKHHLNLLNRAKARGRIDQAAKLESKIGRMKVKTLVRLGSKQWWRRIDQITHRRAGGFKIDYDRFSPSDLNRSLAEQSRRPLTDTPSAISFDSLDGQPPVLPLNVVSFVLRTCKRTSAGPSRIPYWIFQTWWDILAPVYHFVWNLSLSSCEFPSVYKEADIIPLPKVPLAVSEDDIRGISVTPLASRLFERAVHKLFITPQILRDSDHLQFGYKRNMSTTDCLLTLVHRLLSHLDEADVDGVHTLLIDLRKAFDSVPPELISAKLKKFTSNGYIQRWVFSFLTNRTQRLQWKGVNETFLEINLGCSQGTVGGPNFYNVFSDDDRAKSNQCDSFKFADDKSTTAPCF